MSLSALRRCAALALANVTREYPNHLLLLATSDADLRPPRQLTPAFYGSFDWHSAVHAHWSLVRLLRLAPESFESSDAAREVLRAHLTADRIEAEREFAARPERAGWERPYGLAWLLQLCGELREWSDDAEARAWAGCLAPLESLAIERLLAWLPKLRAPLRSGEHPQSAFSMGLMHDWARIAGHAPIRSLLEERALAFHSGDRDAPIRYEPSAYDFLSPILGEADLMRRVLPPSEFVTWLDRLLPMLDSEDARRWLTPAVVADPSDGKLAHLDGLNLSRAWMLEGVLSALPARHHARPRLEEAALAHRTTGLEALAGGEYAGTHWLGSFAVYLETRRGLT